MNIFRRSRAEDAVDHYNHTWSVLLMLLLFLVTWLSSFSPDLQPSVSDTFKSSRTADMYQAHCWCPSDFQIWMVNYANSLCAAALNTKIRGDKDVSPEGALVYEVPMDSLIPVNRDDRAVLLNITTGGNKDDMTLKFRKMESEAKDLNKDISYFAYIKTPVVLFLFAVFLKLPHVVWILLSSCCGLNVDSTLETAVRAQTLDQDSRKKFNKELAQAVSKDLKQNRVVTSCFYLLLKILMIVATVGELVVIRDTIQEYHKLRDEQEANKSKFTEMMTTPAGRDFSKTSFLCDFSTRRIQDVQRWTLQCVFSKIETTLDSISTPQTSTSSNILDLVGTVHAVVGIYLLVLVIINVLNLLSWLVRLLVGSCHVSVGSNSDLPLDGQLLLHMARLNAGLLVVQDMLGEGLGSARTTQEEAELEKLHE